MSNSILTNIGLTAMAAQFAGLQTTGNNIANSSVAGYSRQQVNLANAPGQWQNGAFYGQGVNVASVTRAHDNYLTGQATSTASLAAMDSTRLNQLRGLENVFQTGENGLGSAVNTFFNSMADISSQPGDLSSRQVALARASDMAARFRDAGNALSSLQSGVTTQLGAAVTQINGLASSLASINQQIAALRGTSQPPNDLLDQRDQLVNQLAQQVNINRVDSSDGTTSITIAGGQQLVLGNNAATLSVIQDPNDATRSAVALVNGNRSIAINENTLGGGGVAGLLQFQNQDLVQGRNLVGRLAASVGMAINAQQSRGVTLGTPLGQVAGTPFFSLGAPQALANSGNARDAGGVTIGSVALSITDPSALQPSDYAMQAGSSAGTWQLTRLSDGLVRTVSSGDVVDGMRIDVSNPQPGDRFLLQPVGAAAANMQALLNDPRDVAAAAPLVASTPVSNTGTAQVSSLTITTVPLPSPGSTVQVAFTNNSGAYDWTLTDAGGTVIGGGSGTWQSGSPLPPPGVDFNGFSMTLTGVPRTGDVLNVAPTSATGVITNNGNALTMMAMQDANLVDGHTASDGYAQAMADVGVRVQSSATSSKISTSVSQQAEQARSSQAGVNLDEEAARLLQYQQGYQAAAKVLTVAQAVFDTLLQATAH